MTAYFGIEKNDEMNDKSEEFFKVFQAFFKQIEQAMPKVEKKKTAGANAKPGVKNVVAGDHKSMMAELIAKQAAKAAANEEEPPK